MNIFDYPDGVYKVRVLLSVSDERHNPEWTTILKEYSMLRLVEKSTWPYFKNEDFVKESDHYKFKNFKLCILEILHNDDKESKLNVVRKALEFDEKKVDDGIAYAQWKEWDGEIITLQREDTRWVWEKLERLRKLEEAIDQLRRI